MSSRWLSNAASFGLARKSSASRAWHWPQTNATDSSPGGCAPWLPWQSLQVGADRSSRAEQELGVHAAPPARVLVDRQRSAVREPVSGHPRRVGMAAAAGLGHAPRVHGGRDVRRRQDAVRAVAVDAGRDLRVALLQQLAVPARPVLALLVDPRAGLEALHERRVGVAAAAERRDLRPLRRAAEGVRGVLLVHRLQVLRQRRIGVAAVAVVAGKTGRGVRTALLVLDDRGRRLAATSAFAWQMVQDVARGSAGAAVRAASNSVTTATRPLRLIHSRRSPAARSPARRARRRSPLRARRRPARASGSPTR